MQDAEERERKPRYMRFFENKALRGCLYDHPFVDGPKVESCSGQSMQQNRSREGYVALTPDCSTWRINGVNQEFTHAQKQLRSQLLVSYPRVGLQNERDLRAIEV